MSVSTPQPLSGWIPVEHRFFGLDRRTFKPGLIVLVVALVLIYGLPALNAAIPWHNEIRAGEVLDLGGGATAVPPPGWQLEDGTLTGGAGAAATSLSIRLGKGGATIELRGAPYSGSASAFLDQVQLSQGDDKPGVNGARGTLTTGAGVVGVVQSWSWPSGDGLEAAFKMTTGTGPAADAAPALLVRIAAPPGQLERYQDEVATLLRSITPGTGQ